MLLNACILHNHFPEEMMSNYIIPIVKDEREDITVMDNYRPIPVTTVLSKVNELITLCRYSDRLYTTPSEFGFKANHSTEMAVFSLKQTVKYYVSRASPVHICFLDDSKAFDRINHWRLFDKLLCRDTPEIIVRSLVTWYCKHLFLVRWGNADSSVLKCLMVSSRRGLSPHIFNIYIDDLSKELSKCDYGCFMNYTCINHLIYADDIVIMAPSPDALQHLLNICQDFATANDIIYNVKKTKCICVKPKSFKDLYVPCIKIAGNNVNFVNCHKYLGYIVSES